ncbi:MAG: aminotransferase class I/II-fold pyridoxal phosphate-dependent enzyme [Bacillota bacterium]|nr:aminotransferase class I/II-fold pyridoxal phosphate-dependent enzyme [Bacillota bacterium]
MGRTLNSRVLDIAISGIRQISNKSAMNPGTINLTVGEPDFKTPEHIKNAAIEAINNNLTKYTANNGLIELRKEIEYFVKDRYKLSYNGENEILITTGASQAIDVTLRTILVEGDEVIFFAPVYTGYIPLVKLQGAVPIIIDTSKNGYKPSVELLKKAVNEKTKAVVIINPSNPTGIVLNKEEIKNLADYLKSQDLYVISDEIYSEITFEQKPVSIATFEGMYDKTIVINGLSKSHSMTGWRIGFILAPEFILRELAKVNAYNITCAPIISQYAAIEAIKYGRNDSSEMIESYMSRRDYVYNRLVEMGLEVEKPMGAFYIFPKIPDSYKDSEAFAFQLIEEGGVAVVPGQYFSEYANRNIRITYAYSMESLKEALDRIEKFLKNVTPWK